MAQDSKMEASILADRSRVLADSDEAWDKNETVPSAGITTLPNSSTWIAPITPPFWAGSVGLCKVLSRGQALRSAPPTFAHEMTATFVASLAASGSRGASAPPGACLPVRIRLGLHPRPTL